MSAPGMVARNQQQFQQIASTTGSDMGHLMNALEQLGKIYGLLRALILAVIVITALLAFVLSWLAVTSPAAARWLH
jgi:hypothetical protein